MTDALRAIHESARKFDLDHNPNEDVEQFIGDGNGDSNETPAEDADMPDAMPFSAAVKIVETSQDETFQFFAEIQEQLMLKYTAESKKFNASQDHRTLHANLAMGIEQVRLVWGERIAEATDRLQRATTEEKRSLGVNVKQILAASPVPTAELSAKPFYVDDELIPTLPGMKVVSAEAQPRRL
jgi:hypothetical protein